MDVAKHGFKIMGMIRSMIRGYDSGYDSRKCNMHVVINFVYAMSGNAHIYIYTYKYGRVVANSLVNCKRTLEVFSLSHHSSSHRIVGDVLFFLGGEQ